MVRRAVPGTDGPLAAGRTRAGVGAAPPPIRTPSPTCCACRPPRERQPWWRRPDRRPGRRRRSSLRTHSRSGAGRWPTTGWSDERGPRRRRGLPGRVRPVLDRRRFDCCSATAAPNRSSPRSTATAMTTAATGGTGARPPVADQPARRGAARDGGVRRRRAGDDRPARELCDWLAAASNPDGGLPFALPVPDPAASAPFWSGADPGSNLQITAIVAATAHRVAAVDPAVGGHAWLARATEYCLAAVRDLGSDAHAMVLAFAAQLLDAAAPAHPEAAELVESLRPHVPADGLLHVAGGADDEFMRPLDFAPLPGGPGAHAVRARAGGRRARAARGRPAARRRLDRRLRQLLPRGHPGVARAPHGAGARACFGPTAFSEHPLGAGAAILRFPVVPHRRPRTGTVRSSNLVLERPTRGREREDTP